MMNRQIRVEKIIGTVKCVVTCGAIRNASRRNVKFVSRSQAIRQAAPAAICSIINWLAKRKNLNDFTVYFRNMI